jgi:hypothetical protein
MSKHGLHSSSVGELLGFVANNQQPTDKQDSRVYSTTSFLMFHQDFTQMTIGKRGFPVIIETPEWMM